MSHLPEVQSVDLLPILQKMNEASSTSNPPTVAVVLGSDGIWDNWAYEDVTAFVTNPDLRTEARACRDAKRDDDCHEKLQHARYVSKALIESNAIHANRNFGSQADNATGIVLLLCLEPSASSS